MKKVNFLLASLIFIGLMASCGGSGKSSGNSSGDGKALKGKYVLTFHESPDGSVLSASQINNSIDREVDIHLEILDKNKFVFVFDEDTGKGTYKIDGSKITLTDEEGMETSAVLEDNKIVMFRKYYDKGAKKEAIEKLHLKKTTAGADSDDNKSLTGKYVFSHVVRYDGKVVTEAQIRAAGTTMDWSFEFPGRNKFKMVFNGDITKGTYEFDGRFITIIEEDGSESILIFEDDKIVLLRKYVEEKINKEVVERQYFEKI